MRKIYVTPYIVWANYALDIDDTTGDEVQTADGGTKKLSDVFSDWHVPASKRQYIPVVQELKSPGQRIVCILGSPLGYKDWIVKNEKV